MTDSIGGVPRLILPAAEEKPDPLHAIARRLFPLVRSRPDGWREAVRRWANDPPLHGDDGVLPVPFPETLTPDERLAILAAIHDAYATDVARIDPWPLRVLPPLESADAIPGEYQLAIRYGILVSDRLPKLRQDWDTHEAAIELFISEAADALGVNSTSGVVPMLDELQLSNVSPNIGDAQPADRERLKIDQAIRRLLSVFTGGMSDEKFQRAAVILLGENLNANEKLTKIDSVLRLPATASAEQLGKLVGVSKQAVLKTDWWFEQRRGEKVEEVGRRRERHVERARQHEPSQPSDDDE